MSILVYGCCQLDIRSIRRTPHIDFANCVTLNRNTEALGTRRRSIQFPLGIIFTALSSLEFEQMCVLPILNLVCLFKWSMKSSGRIQYIQFIYIYFRISQYPFCTHVIEYVGISLIKIYIQIAVIKYWTVSEMSVN